MRKKIDFASILARLHPDRVPILWLGVILLGAAALRLVNIGIEPLWGDEILSRNIALEFMGRPAELLAYLGQVEVHPPLYYFVLQGWGALVGLSDEVVRYPSFVFSLGVVAMSYVLGRRIFADTRIALLAAALTAYLPIQIEYGQEARPYSAICLMGCLAVLAVWEHLRSGRRAWLALYVVASVAGMYLHYSYALVLVTTAVWWLVEVVPLRERPDRGTMTWLLSHTAVFLAFWPWLDEMLMKVMLGGYELLGLSRNMSGLRSPNLLGDTVDSMIWLTKQKAVMPLQQTVVLLAVGLLVWLSLRLVRVEVRKASDRRAFGTMLLLLLLPVVLFLYSPQSIDYTDLTQRHLLFATVPLVVLLAALAVRSGARRGVLLVVVLVASLFLNVVEVTADDSSVDMQHRVSEAALYINEQYREGDLVVVVYNIVRSSVQGYLDQGITVETLIPVQYGGLDVMRGHRVQGFIENEVQSRLPSTSREELFERLDRLDRKYRPRRIWIQGLRSTDYQVHDWFVSEEWRHAFPSINDLLRVDLYVRR